MLPGLPNNIERYRQTRSEKSVIWHPCFVRRSFAMGTKELFSKPQSPVCAHYVLLSSLTRSIKAPLSTQLALSTFCSFGKLFWVTSVWTNGRRKFSSSQVKGLSVSTIRSSKDMAVSQVRQNFHEDSEAGINKQINWELYASYTYMSMAGYFRRDDVALPGFAKFFEHSSKEEHEHARKLIDYQNQRGGRVVLNPIDKPNRDEWGSGLDALIAALDLEKTVNKSLLELHKIADGHGDAQMCDFLESHYLEEQVESIKEIGDLITQCKRVGPGLGEWHFDRVMHDKST
ncbi:unnamed protein product [Notodromas monacha]|uniref:Ferritin n=1 Tax=Notodromas monacha TaxID=399045 RepID=A0A7R9GBL1_9CRUS|nr:unnamed protein product [Notodromas monacha]CAG0914921.1 unnamed protein product [Notodromas monacha]